MRRISRNALVVLVPPERINLCLLSCSRNSLSFIFFPRISSYIRGAYHRSNIQQSIKVQFGPSDMGRESDHFARDTGEDDFSIVLISLGSMERWNFRVRRSVDGFLEARISHLLKRHSSFPKPWKGKSRWEPRRRHFVALGPSRRVTLIPWNCGVFTSWNQNQVRKMAPLFRRRSDPDRMTAGRERSREFAGHGCELAFYCSNSIYSFAPRGHPRDRILTV